MSDHLEFSEPIEETLDELALIADEQNIHALIYDFGVLPLGETLQEHVQREFQQHGALCSGPHVEVSFHPVTHAVRMHS